MRCASLKEQEHVDGQPAQGEQQTEHDDDREGAAGMLVRSQKRVGWRSSLEGRGQVRHGAISCSLLRWHPTTRRHRRCLRGLRQSGWAARPRANATSAAERYNLNCNRCEIVTLGPGRDIILGGPDGGAAPGGPPNSDIMFGGPGNDVNLWAPGDGSEAFVGGQGHDAIIFGATDREADPRWWAR